LPTGRIGFFIFKEKNMPTFVLTPTVLAAIAGAVLSLLFSYILKLNTWYAAKDEETKRAFMLLLLVVLSGGIFGLQCAGILEAGLSCDKQGIVQLVYILISAVVANQATYKITPQLATVKAAKANGQNNTPVQ
jgi:hypothetical protein